MSRNLVSCFDLASLSPPAIKHPNPFIDVHVSDKMPRQMDGSSCAIYVATAAEQLAKGRELKFRDDLAHARRKEMFLAIMRMVGHDNVSDLYLLI